MSFNVDVETEGDLLIRVRNFVTESVRYTVLRMMCNSAFFLRSPVRFLRKDIDLGDTVSPPEGLFVDMYVEHLPEQSEYIRRLEAVRNREQITRERAPQPTSTQDQNSPLLSKFEIGGDDEEDEEASKPVGDLTDVPLASASISGQVAPVTTSNGVKEPDASLSEDSSVDTPTVGQKDELASNQHEKPPKVDSPGDIQPAGLIHGSSTIIPIKTPEETKPEPSADVSISLKTESETSQQPIVLLSESGPIIKVGEAEDPITEPAGSGESEGEGEDAEDSEEDVDDYLEKLEKEAV